MNLFARVIGACLLLSLGLAAPVQAERVKKPKWELGLGAAGVSLPDYRGSDEQRSYVLPLPWVIYRLEWLTADRSGLKARLFDSDRAEINLSMSATPPVRSNQNRAREGMRDIKPTVEIGPSLDVRLWESTADRVQLDLRMPLRAAFTVGGRSQYAGLDFSPRLNLDVRNVMGAWRLGVLSGPVFGDSRHHEYLYSVADEYATPDRAAYRARGGYAGWQNIIALSREYDSMWVGGFVRYDSLHGAAFEDSPLVRRKSYASVGLAVSWIFAKSAKMVEVED